MNVAEAKELLSFHSGRNSDINNPKWKNGFLGSLRPFRGTLIEDNFIEVMECMSVLADELGKSSLDRNLVNDIIGIIHLARAWSEPEGMLGRNHLLTVEQTEQLREWIFIIEEALCYLLEGCVEEAFFDYEEYLRERQKNSQTYAGTWIEELDMHQKQAQEGIREFKENDIDRIMEIWLNGNIQAHNFIKKEYWQNNYETVRQMLPQADIYVYEQNKQIFGFIGLTGNYIAGIFVDGNARNKGIGTQLLNRIKMGRNHLTLHVYKKNQRAVNFYRREGFVIQTVQTDENTGAEELEMVWNSEI